MLIKDIRQVRRRAARSVYRARPISYTAVRSYDISISDPLVARVMTSVLFCYVTGMRGSYEFVGAFIFCRWRAWDKALNDRAYDPSMTQSDFYDYQTTLSNLFFWWRIMLILIDYLLRKLAEKNLLEKDRRADRTAGAKF